MFELNIEPLGETLELEEGQTILDAILRAGLYVPYQCGHGLCGTCKVQILEGDISHGEASAFALLDFERDEGHVLACCATAQSDLTIEAEIEEDPDALSLPIQDHDAEVSELFLLTPRIMGVRLKVGGGIKFQAGQYINLHLPNCDRPRAFSIASSPSNTDYIELNICLVDGGKATTYVFDELKVGDKLKFTAPMGRFFVRETQNLPMIFIAGGSGLSSPKCMIEDLLEKGCNRNIYLFHGARDEKELYYQDLFAKWQVEHSNFKYFPTIDAPIDSNAWDGDIGYVHEIVIREFDGKFEGNSAYMCGPPPMIDAAITALMRGRLFENYIFTEKFITEADSQTKRSPLFKNI